MERDPQLFRSFKDVFMLCPKQVPRRRLFDFYREEVKSLP